MDTRVCTSAAASSSRCNSSQWYHLRCCSCTAVYTAALKRAKSIVRIPAFTKDTPPPLRNPLLYKGSPGRVRTIGEVLVCPRCLPLLLLVLVMSFCGGCALTDLLNPGITIRSLPAGCLSCCFCYWSCWRCPSFVIVADVPELPTPGSRI